MDVHLANLLQANQYAFHAIVVGLVIVSALLVFVFGFKTSVEPPFDKITSPHDDRKTNGKKRKGKEKKPQSNGHVAGVGEARKDTKQVAKKDIEKSPAKEKKPEKTPALKENRDVKPVNTPVDAKKKGKGKENVEMKNKKNKIADEKPKDFDDGEWEQAPSRKDKKNKKSALEEIVPVKTEKKKEPKKKKEEVVEPKEATPTPEPVNTPEKILVEEEIPPKNEVAVVEPEDQEPVDEPKPKRNRKKKGGSKERASSAPGEEEKAAVPAPASPAPASPVAKPSPAKPKKEVPVESPPEPAPKVEPIVEAKPAESSVVFDELGDVWKEARAPKKGGKKKSRKE